MRLVRRNKHPGSIAIKLKILLINVLVLDIDGVLTDGTAVLTAAEREEKRIHFHDLDAVTQARRAGFTLALVTGETSASVDRIAARFGVERVTRGAKDKPAALEALAAELGVSPATMCYIGDSDRDAPALAMVGLGLAPADATPAARAAAHRVLEAEGGKGAVAEAVRMLLRQRAGAAQAHPPDVLPLEARARSIVAESVTAHQRLLDESMPVLVAVAQTFIRALRAGHKILLFGNGGSAADAQHVACELVGRFLKQRPAWPAIALTTDSSVLTAVSNDWAFEEVFARQVRALAQPGDVVVGISTSGGTANVLRGLEAARKQGAVAVGFTGRRGGAMDQHTDVCFYAPADATPRIQELHLLAWHTICQLVEEQLADEV